MTGRTKGERGDEGRDGSNQFHKEGARVGGCGEGRGSKNKPPLLSDVQGGGAGGVIRHYRNASWQGADYVTST